MIVLQPVKILIFALCGLIALASGPAQAQVDYSASSGSGSGSGKTAPQTCDPDYWESMTSRAWMEAEREIVQNKNLIFKPDSVMEYVCFDSFMQHAAQHVGDIFTHTTYFDSKMIIPRGSTQISTEFTLTKAVTDSLKTYIDSNFGHKFLGERAKHREGGVMQDRTLGDASNMRSYQCSVMNNLWQAAKCENFIHNDNFVNDGFRPFDDILDSSGNAQVKGYKNASVPDPRLFPIGCSKPDNGDWTWENAIPRAQNENDQLYKFATPLKKTYDDIRPKLEPGSCSEPIKTGVTVKTSASDAGYDDGVCSNPGCTYNQGGTCQ